MFTLNASMLSSQRAIRVALIGVGGTGAEMASRLVHLHEALRAFGFAGLHVVAFDPDVVTEANVVRQRYTRADIGRPKASTLIHRINLSCGTAWEAVNERFKSVHGKTHWDVVISCVDTRAARKALHGYAFSKGFHGWSLWLDLGNTATTGQAILGTPVRRKRENLLVLPCATELHPELRDTSIRDDDAPSCSAIEALERQDLYVNGLTALHGAQLLWQLFRDQKLDHHARYFDLRNGTTTLRPIPAPAPRKASVRKGLPSAPARRRR